MNSNKLRNRILSLAFCLLPMLAAAEGVRIDYSESLQQLEIERDASSSKRAASKGGGPNDPRASFENP